MSSDEFQLVTKDSTEWLSIYEYARNDKSHELWENYQNIDLDTYEHMIVQLRDNKPISFHGIFNNNRWPNNVSRVCNRLYTLPEYRDLKCSTTGDSIKFDCDNYDKWGKDILFISRGIQYSDIQTSYKKFALSVRWARKFTGYNWVHDDRLYKCCNNECKDCYQFCLWYDPKNIRDTLDIHSISIDEWNLLPISD
jgi:hypothetical protein